jgi:hypothetical protein
VDVDIVDVTTSRAGAEALYAQAGALWKGIGGKWGGDFPGFPDIGHFEFHPGLSVEDVCPVAASCSDSAVDTEGSGTFVWAMAGTVVLAAAAWILFPSRSTP